MPTKYHYTETLNMHGHFGTIEYGHFGTNQMIMSQVRFCTLVSGLCPHVSGFSIVHTHTHALHYTMVHYYTTPTTLHTLYTLHYTPHTLYTLHPRTHTTHAYTHTHTCTHTHTHTRMRIFYLIFHLLEQL